MEQGKKKRHYKDTTDRKLKKEEASDKEDIAARPSQLPVSVFNPSQELVEIFLGKFSKPPPVPADADFVD